MKIFGVYLAACGTIAEKSGGIGERTAFGEKNVSADGDVHGDDVRKDSFRSKRCAEDIALKDEPQIYRLTTAGGEKFLLGGTRQPYAAMAKANYYPESTADAASTGITITYTDRRGPLRLIEA